MGREDGESLWTFNFAKIQCLFLSHSFVLLRQNVLEIFVFIQRVSAFPYDSVFLSRLQTIHSKHTRLVQHLKTNQYNSPRQAKEKKNHMIISMKKKHLPNTNIHSWFLKTRRKNRNEKKLPQLEKKHLGTSLVAQWLRLHAPNTGDQGLIPGQETRSHMQQLRPGTAKSIYTF